VALEAETPLYKKAIAGLFVGGIRLDRVDGKAKLMQHKSPKDRASVLEALFRRGAPGDCAAIEAIREANPSDEAPDFLRGPAGTTLCLAPALADAGAAALLLSGTYWNDIFDGETLVRAHLGSAAWVVLRDARGRVVGSARAITDGAKHAWVYDVIVAPELRGSQAGTALMRLLLDHPAIRAARFVHLGTRDAQTFYERLGFVESKTIIRPYTSTTMTLDKAAPPSAKLRGAGGVKQQTLTSSSGETSPGSEPG
jgi:ribosomal protein S18 acetylase RimI-like enzyme